MIGKPKLLELADWIRNNQSKFPSEYLRVINKIISDLKIVITKRPLIIDLQVELREMEDELMKIHSKKQVMSETIDIDARPPEIVSDLIDKLEEIIEKGE